jgi:hypothetical protein
MPWSLRLRDQANCTTMSFSLEKMTWYIVFPDLSLHGGLKFTTHSLSFLDK